MPTPLEALYMSHLAYAFSPFAQHIQFHKVNLIDENDLDLVFNSTDCPNISTGLSDLSTFFLLGKPNEMYDEIYQRIFDSGHTIANHTYSHAIWGGLYASASSFINDVLKQEKFLEEKLGVKTNIRYWKKSVRNLLR